MKTEKMNNDEGQAALELGCEVGFLLFLRHLIKVSLGRLARRRRRFVFLVNLGHLLLLDVDGELDGVRGRARSEVVHTGLQTLLPRVEVQRRELTAVRIAHVHVERLRLVDEGAAVRRHVDEDALFDFPNRLVNGLEVLRNFQISD